MATNALVIRFCHVFATNFIFHLFVLFVSLGTLIKKLRKYRFFLTNLEVLKILRKLTKFLLFRIEIILPRTKRTSEKQKCAKYVDIDNVTLA